MSESKLTIKRGEVWLIKFKKQDSMGTEIYKTRPAVIFSTQFYNEESKRIIALSLTTIIQPLYKREIPVVINNRTLKNSFFKSKRCVVIRFRQDIFPTNSFTSGLSQQVLAYKGNY